MDNSTLLNEVMAKAQTWLDSNYNEETKSDIRRMMDAEDKTELIESFYRDLEFGKDVLIGSSVFISDHDHGTVTFSDLSIAPTARPLISSPVVIEDNVWIGEKVVILKGVRVGRNSVVAAGAVVTKNVPPYSVVAGVPAKVVRSVKPVA